MTDHDNDQFGPGEIRRGFERIEKQLDAMQKDVSGRYHELANKMNAALGPVSELLYRAEQSKEDLDELAVKVRVNEGRIMKIEARAAAIAGGITAVIFLVKFLMGK